jgi:MHS family proline/betaine transporter-like MFS transporter
MLPVNDIQILLGLWRVVVSNGTRTESEYRVKNVVAGCVGNVLEWYDFALYGFFAPIIAKLFFPSDDQITGLLATFGIFAVGFLMRPIGSVLFGILGDKLGRKKALEISVVMMAIPTTLIGFLPTYESVGILAPILLTIIRLIQGISVGGEFTGSISYVVENAPHPPPQRGFYSSWTVFSLLGGILLGSAIASVITNVLTDAQVQSFGWRIPFILGLLIGIIGLFLRSGLDESPAFKKMKEAGELAKTPIKDAFKYHWKEILTVIGATCVGSINFYLIFVYLTTYLSTETHLLLSSALEINTISMVVLMILTPVMGYLSDKVGRRPILIGGSLILAVLAYPLFVVLSLDNYLYDLLAQCVFALGLAMVFGPFGAMMVELFPARIRMSALSIGYNIGFAIFGGTAPFIATYLIDATGNKLAPSFYLIAASIISLIVFYIIRETYNDHVG